MWWIIICEHAVIAIGVLHIFTARFSDVYIWLLIEWALQNLITPLIVVKFWDVVLAGEQLPDVGRVEAPGATEYSFYHIILFWGRYTLMWILIYKLLWLAPYKLVVYH